jgi:prepilin-type N-terminal cleavage/methylation domain-containing protein/prepilin-type processing-associated H-X9-DG protein
MKRQPLRGKGFTLVELLVVVGLVAMLISLLLPALGKARAAAQATRCLSNLRQMGNAWQMYTSENKGRLMDYAWYMPATPDVAWRLYWPAVLENYRVRGETLLCSAANQPIPFSQNKGMGSVNYAWTGKYDSTSVIRFNSATYRVGSYGFNRYLTAGGGFGPDGAARRITAVKSTHRVPVFMDSIWPDFIPLNWSDTGEPVQAPPNLRGDGLPLGAPDHWKFLIARHGRGVNAVMADGSARWVPLEETYTLIWRSDWSPYRLSNLPRY